MSLNNAVHNLTNVKTKSHEFQISSFVSSVSCILLYLLTQFQPFRLSANHKDSDMKQWSSNCSTRETLSIRIMRAVELHQKLCFHLVYWIEICRKQLIAKILLILMHLMMPNSVSFSFSAFWVAICSSSHYSFAQSRVHLPILQASHSVHR